MIYRRCKKRDDTVWHWRPECEHWPHSEYTEFTTVATNRPGYGKLCRKCEAIQREASKYEARS